MTIMEKVGIVIIVAAIAGMYIPNWFMLGFALIGALFFIMGGKSDK